MDREAALRAVWTAGDLRYKLYANPAQLRMHAGFRAHKSKVYFVLCARRLGKSYWLVTEADAAARSAPHARVLFAAPTERQVRSIVLPLFRQILEDCPSDLRPQWYASDSKWVYPNGSEVVCFGCDENHADKGRGSSAHLAIIDEAGFVRGLDYALKSVILPQLLTTRGRVLVATTPARTKDHPSYALWEQAVAEGAFLHATIHDSPLISAEEKAEMARSMGGEHTSEWRREFLAEWVTDETLGVFPEYANCVTQAYELPPHRMVCLAGDVGAKDLTAGVRMGYDFAAAKYVVEAEYLSSDYRSDRFVAEMQRLEAESGQPLERVLRVVDAPLPMIWDFQRLHGWAVHPPTKDNKQAAVNALRQIIREGRLVVTDACPETHKHLLFARWADRDKPVFDRSAAFGHFDLADAVLYGYRALRQVADKDPRPAPVIGVRTDALSTWRKLDLL